ncbi:MAG: glycoside hydrolase N-terminal domain-containing protein [Puniceicoccaceae bacterium]
MKQVIAHPGIVLFTFVIGLTASLSANGDEWKDMKIWFDEPGEARNETLPLGNGRLGALVYGGVEVEHLQLSEDTLWTHGPDSKNMPGAKAAFNKARELLFAGKHAEAQELIDSEALAPGRSHYLALLGDLRLHFDEAGEVGQYHRELDLDTAVARVRYKQGDAIFTREMFSSYVDQVLVVRLTCDKPGRLVFQTELSRELYASTVTEGSDTLVMTGSTYPETNTMRYEARLKIIPEGGRLEARGDRLYLSGAEAATILIAVSSNFRGDDPRVVTRQQINKAVGRSWEDLRKDHIADHQRLFRRSSIDLGCTDAIDLPTDERVTRMRRTNEDDPHLVTMIYQYGRYLLIASSRPGAMASSLHGIWPGRMGSKSYNAAYHININVNMNYWPAEVTGLRELHPQLFDLIDLFRPGGRLTAQEVYGCGGFVMHHNSDGWGGCGPFGSSPYSPWSGGAGWLCQHVWEHYLFNLDEDFLRNRGYPIMKEAAEFYLDFMRIHPETGELVTGPTSSPENSFLAPGSGAKCALDMGVSGDQEIIWELLTNCLSAAEILGIEDAFTKRTREALDKLALPKIGNDGRLMEWYNDYEEADPAHRHMSHLYGFHPGARITLGGTPELAAAVRKSLEHRLEYADRVARGAGGIVWSRAWVLNFWARFLEQEKAYAELRDYMRDVLEPNLCKKWSTRPYCLDANTGVTAGIAEMLIQSHAGTVHLLPAIPKQWPNGSFRGLRARGAFTVDAAWKNGKLTEASITSSKGGVLKIRYNDRIMKFDTDPGETVEIGE